MFQCSCFDVTLYSSVGSGGEGVVWYIVVSKNLRDEADGAVWTDDDSQDFSSAGL